ISVAENATAVTTVSATDADLPAQAFTYALSGPDAGKFQISATGVLTFVTAPDYESPTDVGADNVYNVTVTVSDTGTPSQSDAHPLAVSVTPVNDNAPILPRNAGGASDPVSVAENATAVTTVVATDADLPGQGFSYALSGPDAARFAISAAGALTFV